MNFPTWERINTHSTLLCCTQSGIGWGNIKQNCMLQSLMTADFKLVHTLSLCSNTVNDNGSSATELVQGDVVH